MWWLNRAGYVVEPPPAVGILVIVEWIGHLPNGSTLTFYWQFKSYDN